MDGDRLRQVVNVVLAVAQVVSAGLSSTGFLGGRSVGAISDGFDSAVVPAGYTFVIWSLIYPLSLGYAVYQARPAVRTDPRLRRTGWWTALAFAASTVWIAFQQEVFLLAQAIITVLLVALGGGLRAAAGRGGAPARTTAERVLVDGHAGVYLGWATVATLAGASQTLLAVGAGGLGLGAAAWAVLVLLVGGAVAAWVTTAADGEPGCPAAVAWGLVGIAVGQFPASPLVGTAALVVALLVVTASVRARRDTPGRPQRRTVVA